MKATMSKKASRSTHSSHSSDPLSPDLEGQLFAVFIGDSVCKVGIPLAQAKVWVKNYNEFEPRPECPATYSRIEWRAVGRWQSS